MGRVAVEGSDADRRLECCRAAEGRCCRAREEEEVGWVERVVKECSEVRGWDGRGAVDRMRVGNVERRGR